MTLQANRRLDKIEQAIEQTGNNRLIKINRFSGRAGKYVETKFIIVQARAALGECEPDNTIFVSRLVKKLKEDFPGFPDRLSREDAETLLAEYGG